MSDNGKKTGGVRRSILMKLLMLLLYILSIPGAVLGSMFTIEFYEGNLYTDSPDEIYKWRIEEYCLMDMRDIELIYQNNGFETYDLSDPYQKTLYEDLMKVYAPSATNFEFVIKDMEENVVLESYTDNSYRYSRTEPIYRTVYRTEQYRMTPAEFEGYSAPANADVSVEEVWETVKTKIPTETTPETQAETQPDATEDHTLTEELDHTETAAPTEATEQVCYYNVTVNIPEYKATHYLTGYVRSELTVDDEYAKLENNLQLAYDYRYVPILVLAVSVLLFSVSLCYLVVSAGYRRGKEAPEEGTFDKIPFDLFSAALAFAGLMVILFADEFTGSFGTFLEIGFICCALVLCALIVLWWLCSLAVRIRTKTIIRNTLIAVVCRRLHSIFSETYKLPIVWQAAGITIGVIVFQMIAIVIIGEGNEFGLVLLFFQYLGLIAGVCLVVYNLHQLEKGAEKISDGDLSYKIETEKLLPLFRRHGESLNRIGEGMNHAVSERMKSEMFKTELIANVSHDIRTPLTSIINYTDLLSKLTLEDAQAAEYIEVISRQSARLRKLTEDVLEASKATTGNMKVQLERMDLRVMLEQLLGEYEERLEAHSLQMVCSISEDTLPIMADGRLLWRVMDNLFANVCKYAMKNTRVYLDAGVRDNKVELTIRNISAVQLHISAEELMERFVQGDRSRNTEGSGLGLSIAQSLTNLQGGTLELNIDGDLFKVKVLFSRTQ